jgi:hypothetical protein
MVKGADCRVIVPIAFPLDHRRLRWSPAAPIIVPTTRLASSSSSETPNPHVIWRRRQVGA